MVAAGAMDEPNPDAAHPPGGFLGGVRNTSLEELLPVFEERIEDPLVREFLNETLQGSPRDWKADAILESLEDRFGYDLDPTERDALTIRIRAYRHATQAAFLHYETDLTASMANRIRDGNYERQDRVTGEMVGEGQEKDSRQNLAVALRGRTRFAWPKNEYPELHRLDIVHKYIPVLMADELHEFFRERERAMIRLCAMMSVLVAMLVLALEKPTLVTACNAFDSGSFVASCDCERGNPAVDCIDESSLTVLSYQTAFCGVTYNASWSCDNTLATKLYDSLNEQTIISDCLDPVTLQFDDDCAGGGWNTDTGANSPIHKDGACGAGLRSSTPT